MCGNEDVNKAGMEEDINQERSTARVRELLSSRASHRLSYTVQYVNNRAIEQERGAMFILLSLCFLSLRWEGIADKVSESSFSF